jgi:hypothetical protein
MQATEKWLYFFGKVNEIFVVPAEEKINLQDDFSRFKLQPTSISQVPKMIRRSRSSINCRALAILFLPMSTGLRTYTVRVKDVATGVGHPRCSCS